MKRIVSMTLEESTVQGIDAYKTEIVKRSELVDALLQHILQSPEFIWGFVRNIELKVENKLQTLSEENLNV